MLLGWARCSLVLLGWARCSLVLPSFKALTCGLRGAGRASGSTMLWGMWGRVAPAVEGLWVLRLYLQRRVALLRGLFPPPQPLRFKRPSVMTCNSYLGFGIMDSNHQ
jgi:hypothetical protein